MLQRLIIVKYLLSLAVVFHHNDLIIGISGLIDNGFHTARQILHVILVGNHNGNQRLFQNRIANPENRGECPGALHLGIHSVNRLNVIMNGPLSRINGIRLCIDILGYGRFVRTPVVQCLRYMAYLLGLRSKPENHIMILAAVIFTAEQSRLIQKLPGKCGKMADIIISSQVINGKIRLKVEDNHMINAVALKGNLVTVNVICPRLIDCLRIFKECSRMQDIVMVKKTDIISCRQLQALVGIAGNSIVVIQHMINNALILFCILLTDLSYISMFMIASVRQTQLPVPVGLIFYGIQHICEELLRRIVKRHQDTELHLIFKNRLPLLFRLLRCGEAGCPVALHVFALLKLAAHLAH